MAMREMYMARTMVLRSKSGHTCHFEANKPTLVHPYAVEEAIAAGAAFADGSLYQPESAPVTPTEPMGFERKEALFKACQTLATKNDPDDFTANGIPKLTALAGELGWSTDRREADAVWREVLQARANEL